MKSRNSSVYSSPLGSSRPGSAGAGCVVICCRISKTETSPPQSGDSFSPPSSLLSAAYVSEWNGYRPVASSSSVSPNAQVSHLAV